MRSTLSAGLWSGGLRRGLLLAAGLAAGWSVGCKAQRFDTVCEGGDCAQEGTGGATAGSGGTPSAGGEGGGGAGASAAACSETCEGSTPFCDIESGECVECVEHAGCTETSASRCEAGACQPCTSSDHCTGIPNAPTCDLPTGTCVECTPTDESACGDNSCDPATHHCTETARQSRTRCQACVADSECQADYRCVPMQFQGEPREGGYCLKTLATGCVEPLMVPTTPRGSLSGAEPEVYCGVSESRTSCEAVLDLLGNRVCPGATNEECGVPGLDDARCETVNGGANRCTYSCSGGAQCPDEYACGGAPDDYCGVVP